MGADGAAVADAALGGDAGGVGTGIGGLSTCNLFASVVGGESGGGGESGAAGEMDT